LFGAVSADNTNPSLLIFDYYQNNNTYNWENTLKRNFDFGRLKCDFDVNTSSTLIKKPYKRWQEHLWTNFSADYKIADGFYLAPFMSHSRNALQDKIIYTSELKLTMPYKRFKFFEINPFVANKAIKRVGDEPTGIDKGLGYGFSTHLKPLKILANQMESSVSYKYYDLNRIPYSEFNARLGGLMAWGTADTLRWMLKDVESTTRYISRQLSGEKDIANIVRQVKVDRRAEYLARIRLPVKFSARLTGDLSFISYYYNPDASMSSILQSDNYTEARNFNVEFERALFGKIRLLSAYSYGWSEKDFGRSELDQWHEMGELSFKASAEIFPDDSISFDGIIGVTSYYSLRGSSVYDRDLKTKIGNVRYKHMFNRYFNSEIMFGYSNFYQIYTSRYNSANNNQNETYILKSTFKWDLTSGIEINQSYEIRANYIIYDYIPNPLETPSRIFRRGSSETGLKLRLSDKFILIPGYAYRYEDYGKLIWEENNWQQATGWDRRYHNLSLKVSYYPFRNFGIEPECSWESKKEYDHKLDDSGPTFERGQIIRDERLNELKRIAGINIIWNFSQSEHLHLSYSRRKWENMGKVIDISEFVSASVRYTF